MMVLVTCAIMGLAGRASTARPEVDGASGFPRRKYPALGRGRTKLSSVTINTTAAVA
jgi:hypothetical protein